MRTFHLWPVPADAPEPAQRFGDYVVAVCETRGLVHVDYPARALFAVAPLLPRRICNDDWAAPELGTLIFHPSALPVHRGPDAIRHTLAAGERVSAATWFWCDDGLDTGPICEQELVILDPQERPGRAYEHRFIPAALRALHRALDGILAGSPRRVPQDHRLSTYESFWRKAG